MIKNYLNFKEANCKNCYKCLRECPVKAISVVNDQAKINPDLCVLCGHCTTVCHFNAKEVLDETSAFKQIIAENKNVIASVAPAFAASFGLSDFSKMRAALMRLGFSDAFETSEGANAVTIEYDKILKTGKMKNLIASACPSIVRLIQIYYPNALPFLASVDSPMVAHAKMLKSRYADAKIVFVGPCIAKKREAAECGIIDCALTFEEVSKLFSEKNIIAKDCEPLSSPLLGINTGAEKVSGVNNNNNENNNNNTADVEIADAENLWNKAKFYPINRGIIKSFDGYVENYEYISIDGLKRAAEVLANIDNLSGMFFEMHACEFSCINGPCSLIGKNGGFIKATEQIRSYTKASQSDKLLKIERKDISKEYKRIGIDRKMPSEAEIKAILEKTGKFSKDDELDCGACGYSSCREKAIAVFNNMAEVSMCVPYMRERAESMSYDIIQNSPNGIIAVDDNFSIIEINKKARELLGIEKPNVKGELLERYYNPTDFYLVMFDNASIAAKPTKIEKTGVWVEVSINRIKNQNMLFCIMKDITQDIATREKLDKIKTDTLATTDDVIKKQMRVVQEIASLLGETAAETKIALIKLKNTIKD